MTTLGPFSNATSGAAELHQREALATTGTVSSAGNLTLTTNAGNLTLGGAVTGNTVTLASAGTISDAANVITATTLTGSSIGGATMTGANQITTFGGFTNTGGGTLSFNNAESFATTGTVNSAGTAGNLTLATTGTGSNLTLGGAVTASGTLTASTVNGNITLDTGATLTASGGGDAIKLEAGGNTPAGTTTGGDFVNNGGASALSAPNGKWLVYTGDLNQGQGCTGSSCTVVGGLTPYTERLGTSTTNFTPAPGINYVFYRDAPTLTITPDSGQNKIYGSNDPTLTYTFTGLVNGDLPVQSAEFSGALSRNGAGTLAGENVGNYTITQGSLVSTLNYTLDVNPTAVAFTISPATLTYVANPASVVQSSAIPTLTGTVTGFVKDETLASATTGTLEFSTKATINSPAGSYAIDGGGLTADHGNYTLVQAPDNATALIITPTPQTQFISQNVLPTTPPPSLTPGQGGNTQGNRQPGPTGRTGTGPGAGPGGLPPQFGARFFVPAPVGETRYVPNELVLQIPTDIPPTELQAMMERLGLTVVAGEKLDLLGVTLYRVRIGNGRSPASVIQALTAYQNVAGAQPNYTYRLVEDFWRSGRGARTGSRRGSRRARAGGRCQPICPQQAWDEGRPPACERHQRCSRGDRFADRSQRSGTAGHDLGAIRRDRRWRQAAAPRHRHGGRDRGTSSADGNRAGSADLRDPRLFEPGRDTPTARPSRSSMRLDWAVGQGVRVINMSFTGPRDPSMERALQCRARARASCWSPRPAISGRNRRHSIPAPIPT